MKHKVVVSKFLLLLLLTFCLNNEIFANDSFSGTIRLPNGNATINNSYELELVSYDLLSRVDGRQRRTVSISKGSSSTNFSFPSIGRRSLTTSGFSLAIICRRCEEDIPVQQFWTIDGTEFLSTEAIISPFSSFPFNIDYTLAEGTSISGRLQLGNGGLAERNLNLIVSAIETGPPNVDSGTSGGFVSVTIPKGSNTASFSINGIRPDGDGLKLQYSCQNCFTDYRAFGDASGFLFPQINNANNTLTLLNTGLAISGAITIPKTLTNGVSGKLTLNYTLQDFDDFFQGPTVLSQTITIEKVPSKLNYGILIPDNRWESFSLEYACFSVDNEPCIGVIPRGFYDETSQPFNVNLNFPRGIFIDPFEVEFNSTNENIDFCIIPDEDFNGVADTSKSACRIFTIAPIMLLLNN